MKKEINIQTIIENIKIKKTKLDAMRPLSVEQIKNLKVLNSVDESLNLYSAILNNDIKIV